MGSTDGTEDGKLEVLLLGASLGSRDGIEVGCTEGTEIWIFDKILLGKHLVHMMVQILGCHISLLM